MKSHRYLEIHYEISAILRTFKTVGETFPIIINTIRKLFPLLTVIIIETNKCLSSIKEWHHSNLSIDNIQLAKKHALNSYNYLSGIDLSQLMKMNWIVSPFYDDSTTVPVVEASENHFVLLPLLSDKGLLLGAIQFENASTLQESDLKFIDSIINLIAITLDRHIIIQTQREMHQIDLNNHAIQLDFYQQKIEIEKMEASIRAREDLMRICGHELKTPLTALRLQTQMVMKKILKNDPRVYEPNSIKYTFETYDKEIMRLVHLVDNILNINQMNIDKLQFSFEPVNLSLLITNIFQRFSCIIQESCNEIYFSVMPDIIGTWDGGRLEQVVINLLMNAIHYGNKRPISISLIKNDNWAILSIRDQGIGISIENQERIFQPYERAISVDEISGLGLGLFIVKEIITAHSGSISVESEIGNGSNFIVKLPLNP